MNNRQLADVNVLLALVWPRHVGHLAAHSWFARTGASAWATNPLTQLGVLRLLTNPAVTQDAVSTKKALQIIEETTHHAGHEYWPLDYNVLPQLATLSGKIRGHNQWTDAMLLLHAIHCNGRLVTFDAGIRVLAADQADRVVILKASDAY